MCIRDRRKILTLTALAALAAPTAGEAAAIERQVYLHCNGYETGVAQVDWLLGSHDHHATFDENAPSNPDRLCMTPDTFASGASDFNPIYDFPIMGQHAGEIRNLTIDFYAIEASGSRVSNEFTVNLHLQVNGVDVVKRPTAATTAAHATAVPTNGPARRYQITITDINLEWGYYDVALTVYPKFVDGSGILAWVYDNPDFPSGLTFNDATPAAKTMKAYL